MKVVGKMGASSSDSNELKEKIKKIEERVYSHDAKFADQQLMIDSTSVNLQMHQMIPHEASNNQEQNNNVDKLQEELGQFKEKIVEFEKIKKNIPQEIEDKINKLDTKIDETQKELKLYSFRNI